MAAIHLPIAMIAQLLLPTRGWESVAGTVASDVQLIQVHVLDQQPNCVDNDAGAVQLAKDHARVDDVSGCSDVGPYCADTNLSSQVLAVCCATCSALVKHGRQMYKCTKEDIFLCPQWPV